MPNLKIIYLLYRFPALSETFILRELEELQNQGLQIRIISLLNPKTGPKNVVAQGLQDQVSYLPTVTSLAFWWSHVYFLSRQPFVYIWLLMNLLKQPYKAMPVKLFGWRLYIFLRAVNAAYMLRNEKFDLIHTHFAAWPGAATWIVSKLLKCRYTITAGHGYDIYTASTLVDLVTADAEHVITVAEYNRQVVIAMSPRLKQERVSLIPCSIDFRQFLPPVRRSPTAQLRLISVGRLVEKKGHQYLLRACAKLKTNKVPFSCTIIGAGTPEEEQSLRELVEELGLTNEVTLAGAKPFAEIYTALLTHDLFVMPCVVARDNDRDAAPVVMVEAAATGLPIVSSLVGGVTDVVIDGVTGILVPEKDVEAIADAITLFSGNPELRWRMGLNGRCHVEQRFDVQKNARTLIRIFEEAART